MNWREATEEMRAKSHTSGLKISKTLGKAENYYCQVQKRSKDVQTKTLIGIASAMNYEVVLRPKNYVRLMDKEILLDE